MCGECQGSRETYREKKKIKKETWGVNDFGHVVKLTETIEIGGLDACSKCAERAEIEYQGVIMDKNMNREQLGKKVERAKYDLILAENNDSIGMAPEIDRRRREYYRLWKLLDQMNGGQDG